jgi:murein L,D-transpeptidase YafK
VTRRVLIALGSGIAIYGAVLALSAHWARAEIQHQPCPASGSVVQVDTGARALTLCRAGREEASFRVALGRGGLDKRTQGDGRTPRGHYTLAAARPSHRYHLFLPVGYPSSEQAKLGFTGSAIGVHGPHVAFAWLGNASAWTNWTEGCIALPTRAAIEQVAEWVASEDVSDIIIR